HVKRTMRVHVDVTQHYDVVVAADVLERLGKRLDRAFAIAAEEFAVRIDDTTRGFLEAFAVGIVTGPRDERTNRLLGLFACRADNLGAASDGRIALRHLLYDRIHTVSDSPFFCACLKHRLHHVRSNGYGRLQTSSLRRKSTPKNGSATAPRPLPLDMFRSIYG